MILALKNSHGQEITFDLNEEGSLFIEVTDIEQHWQQYVLDAEQLKKALDYIKKQKRKNKNQNKKDEKDS